MRNLAGWGWQLLVQVQPSFTGAWVPFVVD